MTTLTGENLRFRHACPGVGSVEPQFLRPNQQGRNLNQEKKAAEKVKIVDKND